MRYTHAIYQSGQLSAQTACFPNNEGILIASYRDGQGAQAFVDELNSALDHDAPPYRLLEWDDFTAELRATEDDQCVTPWTEITEEDWWYWLEVLPPCRRRVVRGVELFFLSEAMTSDIHLHVARLGTRRFTRHCRTSTAYETLAAEVASLVTQAA